jgi:peptide/nickel transport system permease protein
MKGFREFFKRFRRNRLAVGGLIVLIAITAVALVAAAIYAADPRNLVGQPLLWPGQDPAHPLGTDTMGRDLAAGLVHGALVSVSIGLLATALAVVIGVGVGAPAGYYGGWIDRVLLPVIELFQTLPPFIFALVIVAILRPSVLTIVLAIGLVSWPVVSRRVRDEFNSLRDREFVLAGIAAGMSDARIVFTQILPNVLPAIAVTASLNVATAILLEAGLTFLGLGDPSLVSWGTIIGAGRDALHTAWYIVALPGIAILITVLAINLVSDGLNDAFDHRLRNR